MGIADSGLTRPIPNDSVRSASLNAVDDYMLKTIRREIACMCVPSRLWKHLPWASPPYELVCFRYRKRKGRTWHAHEDMAHIHNKALLSRFFIALRYAISRPFVLSGSCEESVREPACQS